MPEEEVRKLLEATISYCMNQFDYYSGGAYDRFLEEFEERPPNESHLPEPALSILKAFVANELD